ncbi:Aste57867_13795 [Aphanomyces stellatus]|uniref:Aste57867_13795 protein n=1 Tax=Aphanomyces stellatus TaxID=120398 RepID=A0A485KZ21_9STRA|nr:hypothetical protein As57867_013745 [Aphanomyces stellatus]VFT90627.1 Aste57867_13795 [Aphanomyces stellatus]
MKSTRSPRRGIPQRRVLRSRDGTRRPATPPATAMQQDHSPPHSAAVLPALLSHPAPASGVVPPLPLLGLRKTSTLVHPKLSARLVPALRVALDKLDADASATLTKEDVHKHNQVLAEAHDAVELASSDIDMLFLCFDTDRLGVIDRHHVTNQLDKLESERHFHTKGTARPCHTSKKRGAPARPTDIYAQEKFTPHVPPKQTPRSLAW